MVDQTATSSSIGAGQQEPIDSNSDFWVISFIIAQKIAELETMTPVQVVAVHPGTGSPPTAGTVDVQLLVSLLDGANNSSKPGIVYGVPYFRMQGGPWAIVIDPAVNDFGYILSAARDISAVKANPGIQVPGSLRKISFSDGIYVGGILNGTPAATLWLKPDGTWVWSDRPGNVIQSSESGIAATTAPGGDFTVNGISLTLHTHSVAAAPGETGPPVG